jgi:hypothetical protein
MKMILISLLLNLVSGWDIIRTIGFTKLLADKRLELLVMLILVDLGKGIALFYYISSLGETRWLLLLMGTVIFSCCSIKYYHFSNIAYFLPMLGYLWPAFPEIVNTCITLLIIFLIILRKNLHLFNFTLIKYCRIK